MKLDTKCFISTKEKYTAVLPLKLLVIQFPFTFILPFGQGQEIVAWKVNKRGSKRGSSEELELDLIEVLEEDNTLILSSKLLEYTILVYLYQTG